MIKDIYPDYAAMKERFGDVRLEMCTKGLSLLINDKVVWKSWNEWDDRSLNNAS